MRWNYTLSGKKRTDKEPTAYQLMILQGLSKKSSANVYQGTAKANKVVVNRQANKAAKIQRKNRGNR